MKSLADLEEAFVSAAREAAAERKGQPESQVTAASRTDVEVGTMKGCLVIIERELLGLLRNRGTLLHSGRHRSCVSAVVILKWPSSGVSDLNGQQARETWQWLTYAMLGAAILIVPVFPSTSLVKELRRTDTGTVAEFTASAGIDLFRQGRCNAGLCIAAPVCNFAGNGLLFSDGWADTDGHSATLRIPAPPLHATDRCRNSGRALSAEAQKPRCAGATE